MAIVLCCLVGLMTVPYIRAETGSSKALHHTRAAILHVSSVADTLHLVTGVVADRTEFFCRCGLFTNRIAAP